MPAGGRLAPLMGDAAGEGCPPVRWAEAAQRCRVGGPFPPSLLVLISAAREHMWGRLSSCARLQGRLLAAHALNSRFVFARDLTCISSGPLPTSPAQMLLSYHGFRFPVTLTCFHMLACTLLSYVAIDIVKLVPPVKVGGTSALHQ